MPLTGLLPRAPVMLPAGGSSALLCCPSAQPSVRKRKAPAPWTQGAFDAGASLAGLSYQQQLELQQAAQLSQQSPPWQQSAPAHWLHAVHTFWFSPLVDVEMEAVAVSARAKTQNNTCNFDFISIPQNLVGADDSAGHTTLRLRDRSTNRLMGEI